MRKFGYPDKNQRPDRLTFGGIHRVGERQSSTGLTMQLTGDIARGRITDASGAAVKRRSQFHIASKEIGALYRTVEVVEV